MRTLPPALTLVLVATTLLPSAPAQVDPGAWGFTDGGGDVRPVDDSLPAGLPATPITDAADLRGVRILEESGIDIAFLYTMSAVTIPASNLIVPGVTDRVSAMQVLCLDVHSAHLGVVLRYNFNKAGEIDNLNGILYKFDASCGPGLKTSSAAGEGVTVRLDAASPSFQVFITKKALGKAIGADAVVAPGDVVENVRAFSRLILVYSFPDPLPPVVYALADSAPDAAPYDKPYTLSGMTHNGDLLLSAPTAGPPALSPCAAVKLPTITLEGGAYQAVPIRVHNKKSDPVTATLSATTAAAGWEVKILPNLEVPSASDGQPGNASATLIVKTPEGSKRDCAEIHVFGMDQNDMAGMGELVFAAQSAPPLDATHASLFLHTRDAHMTPPPIWMNPAQEDPSSAPDYSFRLAPAQGTQVGSMSAMQFKAKTDGVYGYDLLLAVDKPAKFVINARSTPVPTNARFRVELKSGGEALAAGQKDVVVPTVAADLEIPLAIQPDIWKNPLRRAAAGDALELAIRYEPLPAAAGTPLPPGPGAGYVDTFPGKSRLDLPIAQTVVTNQVRLGSKGGLVSLDIAPAEAKKYANEGRGVLFNFTLTNEGADAAGFEIGTNISSSPPLAWKASLASGAHLERVPPGEHQRFQVLVVAPGQAPESAEARVTVTAKSHFDDSSATSLVVVHVAKQEQHGFVVAPTLAAKKTMLPAPSAALAVLALAGLAAFGRRHG